MTDKEHIKRQELLAFQKLTMERFDKIDKKIEEARTHMEPSPKTLIKIQEVKDENMVSNARVEAKVDALIKTVDEKLLPTYEKQMSREEAKKILKEDIDHFSYWGKFWLLGVAIIGSLGVMLKFWLSSDK